MAQAQKRGSGFQIIHTATGTVAEGDVIEFTDFVGYAAKSGVSGDAIPCDCFGEFEADKEAPLVITAGDKVYWDAANNRVDKTGTNIPLGIASADAASAATRVRFLLNAGAQA